MTAEHPTPRSLRRGAATLALLAVVAASSAIQSAPWARAATPIAQTSACPAAGNGIVPTAAISFGRSGGNIRPMTVTIADNGSISYDGANPATATYTISPAAVQGLERLAGAEGFWSMPQMTAAPGVLPDIATRFITMRLGCSANTYTVRVRGSMAAFDELYDTLTAAAGISSGSAAPAPSGQSSPQRITLQNAGQTLSYSIGDRVLVQLGTTYSWTLNFNPTGIFNRAPNSMLILGAQGLFTAAHQGRTILTATGDPACRSAHPACALPSRIVRFTLVVQPPIQP